VLTEGSLNDQQGQEVPNAEPGSLRWTEGRAWGSEGLRLDFWGAEFLPDAVGDLADPEALSAAQVVQGDVVDGGKAVASQVLGGQIALLHGGFQIQGIGADEDAVVAQARGDPDLIALKGDGGQGVIESLDQAAGRCLQVGAGRFAHKGSLVDQQGQERPNVERQGRLDVGQGQAGAALDGVATASRPGLA